LEFGAGAAYGEGRQLLIFSNQGAPKKEKDVFL
jgi:hypothetical protein